MILYHLRWLGSNHRVAVTAAVLAATVGSLAVPPIVMVFPSPVATERTPLVPLAAAVIRPCASTEMSALV